MNLHDRSDVMLTIEVSLPTLLFGNNLEELKVKDFAKVVTILQGKLKGMGIDITQENLKKGRYLFLTTYFLNSKNQIPWVFKSHKSSFDTLISKLYFYLIFLYFSLTLPLVSAKL